MHEGSQTGLQARLCSPLRQQAMGRQAGLVALFSSNHVQSKCMLELNRYQKTNASTNRPRAGDYQCLNQNRRGALTRTKTVQLMLLMNKIKYIIICNNLDGYVSFSLSFAPYNGLCSTVAGR
jgi:hypothetical protein